MPSPWPCWLHGHGVNISLPACLGICKLLLNINVFADTYVTHPWLLRRVDNQGIVGSYCGPDATVEVNPHNLCVAQPGVRCPIWPGSHRWPAHWGNYNMRGEASGIQIMVRALPHDPCTEPAQLYMLLKCQQTLHCATALILIHQGNATSQAHSRVKSKASHFACSAPDIEIGLCAWHECQVAAAESLASNLPETSLLSHAGILCKANMSLLTSGHALGGRRGLNCRGVCQHAGSFSCILTPRAPAVSQT